MNADCRIRPAIRADIDAIVSLCREHAAYERQIGALALDRRALERVLFQPAPALHALVAVSRSGLVGYATFTIDVSTWRAAPYLHLDCLYITEAYRAKGVGRQLMAAVVDAADAYQCSVLEWQTPDWNERAADFYRRLGAMSENKRRFVWRPERTPVI